MTNGDAVPDGEALRCSVTTAGTVATIAVVGELDVETRAVLDASIDAQRAAEIRLDLTGVSFIDSSGLSTLLSMKHRLDREGRTLNLAARSPAVERVFELTGVSVIFDG